MMIKRYIFFVSLLSFFLLSSCDSLKRFLARDLEEEDFAMGELYEDEYVEEVPVVSKSGGVVVVGGGDVEPGARTLMGIPLSDGDNDLLYRTIAEWIGTPYRYGGTTKAGVDCSAFVGSVYMTVYGVKLHRVADDIRKDVTLIRRGELAEGDVVFFTNSKGRVSHVGIYLKEGLFAHSSTSRGVIVSRIDDGYWSKHFYGGGRVMEG